MLYKIRVFHTKMEPTPWDSLDEVNIVEVTTPDIKPLAENVSADALQEALTLRLHLGRIPAGLDEYVYLTCDGVGLIHASLRDADPWTTLRHREWRQVGALFLRVEQVREPLRTWWDSLQRTPRWRRILNRLLRRRCGGCLYFDVKGAHEWRSKVTHDFAGISNGPDTPIGEAMHDDITKIEAANYRAPDFRPGEFGYCPRRDCGLSGRLLACGEYKRL